MLVLFPAFWCAIVLALSIFGGWRTLAATLATEEAPRGTRFSGESGYVGGVSYKSALTVHVAPDGMFLTVPWVFRVGHKPLFIPWNAIADPHRVKFLWHEAVRFKVSSHPVMELSLSAPVFDARAIQAVGLPGAPAR